MVNSNAKVNIKMEDCIARIDERKKEMEYKICHKLDEIFNNIFDDIYKNLDKYVDEHVDKYFVECINKKNGTYIKRVIS